MDFSNPESRIEAILQNMLGANNVLDPPESRIEYLLQQILENGGGGGQSAIHEKGVTTTALTDGCDTNPITINGESYTAVDGDLVAYQNKEFLFNGTIWQELGDVSEVMTIIENILEDIAQEFDATASYAVDDYVLKDGVLYKCTTAHTGAWDANDFTATTISDEIADVADALDDIKDGTSIDSFGDVETALAGKQDTLTFDNAPTENSNNPVKSGGVYSALAGKQGTLTAGDYINLNNGNIAVNRNIVRDNYAYNIKFSGDNDLTVTKSQGGTVISTTQYTYEYGSGGGVTYTIDDAYYGGQYFKYTALRDSTTHSAGYTWQVEAHDTSTDVTEYFSTEDLSGYKLVIKSEMDTALAGKVNTENGKGLSTNDYSDTEKAQVATNAEDISSLKSELTTLGLTVQNGKLCAVYNN